MSEGAYQRKLGGVLTRAKRKNWKMGTQLIVNGVWDAGVSRSSVFGWMFTWAVQGAISYLGPLSADNLGNDV